MFLSMKMVVACLKNDIEVTGVLSDLYMLCHCNSSETAQVSEVANLFSLTSMENLRVVLSLWSCRFIVNASEMRQELALLGLGLV